MVYVTQFRKFFLLILFLALLSGCDDCKKEELIRSTSPDGKLDAVLIVEMCGGAVGSVDYFLYIVPRGKVDKYNYKKEGVLHASHVEGEAINWIDSRTMEIEYKQAIIYDFKNALWVRNNYNIEVRETPLTSSHSFKLWSSD